MADQIPAPAGTETPVPIVTAAPAPVASQAPAPVPVPVPAPQPPQVQFQLPPQIVYPPSSKYICILVLTDFSLTVKAATLIFISGSGSAISSAKEGKSSFIYNLVKSY